MKSIVGGFRGVAPDKRQRRLCGYPQRVIRLVSISVDIAYRLPCITTNCAHIIYHGDPCL